MITNSKLGSTYLATYSYTRVLSHHMNVDHNIAGPKQNTCLGRRTHVWWKYMLLIMPIKKGIKVHWVLPPLGHLLHSTLSNCTTFGRTNGLLHALTWVHNLICGSCRIRFVHNMRNPQDVQGICNYRVQLERVKCTVIIGDLWRHVKMYDFSRVLACSTGTSSFTHFLPL